MERYQDGGPTSSKKFNELARTTSGRIRKLAEHVSDLEGRVEDLELLYNADTATTNDYGETISQLSAAHQLSTTGRAVIPVCAMNVVTNGSVPTEANGTTVLQNPLAVDTQAGLVTLKQSSVDHKLRYEPVTGTTAIHPEVKTAHTLAPSDHGATINDESYAIDGKSMRAFMAHTALSKALVLTYYATVPYLAIANKTSNMITVQLAPGFHCSLVKLQYATVASPAFEDGSHWHDFPREANVAVKDRWQPPLNDGTNVQNDVSVRRYYFPDTVITAVRAVVKTKMDGSSPATVALDGTPSVIVGIRELDVAHVNFATTGSLVLEATIPSDVFSIDLDSTKAVCVNEGSGDVVYDKDLTIYHNTGLGWTKYTGGQVIGTKVRVKLSADLMGGTSPAISAIDFVYTPEV